VYIEFRSESGDAFAPIVLETQTRQRKVPWVFRSNDLLAQWVGIQMDRVRTPPPEYTTQDPSGPLSKDKDIPEAEEQSVFRNICQYVVWLVAIAVAVVWIYFYITSQLQRPQSAMTVMNLVILVLYLSILGFFISLFIMRLAVPSMVRLGDYATHDADRMGRVVAIAGVVGLWIGCVSWVFVLPLIPVVGGIVARRAS